MGMVWLVLGLVLWPVVALCLGLAIGRAISACESSTAALLPRRRRAGRMAPTVPDHETSRV
jgi:hypothetical protein